MFGLIDGNNFYASCERIFRPELRKVPVVVLSNNDGCAIARSNEAKKLGITMVDGLGKKIRASSELIKKAAAAKIIAVKK